MSVPFFLIGFVVVIPFCLARVLCGGGFVDFTDLSFEWQYDKWALIVPTIVSATTTSLFVYNCLIVG